MFSINPIELVEIVRKRPVAVGLLVALALSGYAVYEVRTLELGFPQAFGDWERLVVDQEYQARQDGFVLVYTSRGNVHTDRDFEIFVSDRRDNLRLEENSRARGQMWDSAISPVPRGHWWVVGESDDRPRDGNIVVFWLPLVGASE